MNLLHMLLDLLLLPKQLASRTINKTQCTVSSKSHTFIFSRLSNTSVSQQLKNVNTNLYVSNNMAAYFPGGFGGRTSQRKQNQNKIRNLGLVQASNNYLVQYITYLFILEDLDLADNKKAWKVWFWKIQVWYMVTSYSQRPYLIFKFCYADKARLEICEGVRNTSSIVELSVPQFLKLFPKCKAVLHFLWYIT